MLLPRIVVAILPVGLAVIDAGVVFGQNYPNKPVRMVTASVGGSTDVAARAIAQGVSVSLGQQMIVDNRGAGIATIEYVARAPADGYTLLYFGSPLWLTPLVQNKSPDETMRNFSPVTWTVTNPSMLVVHPSLPVKSVKELIALSKARPGVLNYGSGPPGSTATLAAELFKSLAGVNIVRVPYKGGGPALMALVAGEIHLTFNTTTIAAPHLKTGRLRALAMTGAKRSAQFPEFPTVAEAGVPGYEWENMSGIFAPAKTPPAIISHLHQHVAAFLGRTEVKAHLLDNGAEAVGGSGEQFSAKIKSEIDRMGKVIRDAGIHAE